MDTIDAEYDFVLLGHCSVETFLRCVDEWELIGIFEEIIINSFGKRCIYFLLILLLFSGSRVNYWYYIVYKLNDLPVVASFRVETIWV